jgi:hypothetical protein
MKYEVVLRNKRSRLEKLNSLGISEDYFFKKLGVDSVDTLLKHYLWGYEQNPNLDGYMPKIVSFGKARISPIYDVEFLGLMFLYGFYLAEIDGLYPGCSLYAPEDFVYIPFEFRKISRQSDPYEFGVEIYKSKPNFYFVK